MGGRGAAGDPAGRDRPARQAEVRSAAGDGKGGEERPSRLRQRGADGGSGWPALCGGGAGDGLPGAGAARGCGHRAAPG
ncbi:MAG: ATP-dependent helicase, partial [Gemmatimonadetes bacterium]|nr:ATP-dependent helicase [Gemmatimonadota bacterium]